VTVTSAAIGTGNGTLSYQVSSNAGGARSDTFTIAGFSYAVEQQPAALANLNFVGSMPHIAAEENWTTTFTFVNKGSVPFTGRFSLFADTGDSLTLPLKFPQTSSASSLLAGALDRTLSANASLIVNTAGAQTPPVQVGSAQLAATGAIDGFAIFHLIPGAQEAVVPLETRNARSYLLAYDNIGGVVLGVALQNISTQPTNIPVLIRDDSGAEIGTGTLSLPGSGHTSFVLSNQFPVTANLRGTVEFDTPSAGQISVLGIRTTQLGTTTTLTTIPALSGAGASGGSIAHLASGNGWTTTFVLVNTGTSPAHSHLKFLSDSGNLLSLPISFPQTGAVSNASTVDQTLTAGATLLIESTGAVTDPLLIGSAQLTSDGNVGGFVIFRYNPNGQEAVVPLESRQANSYIVAYDNTAGTATGIALNSVSSQQANIAVIIRDDNGAQIGSDSLALAPNGHYAFTMGTDRYAQTAGIRGTIEFVTPPGGQVGALGIRIPIAHTFTTLPALAK